jgi:hypothetical protein
MNLRDIAAADNGDDGQNLTEEEMAELQAAEAAEAATEPGGAPFRSLYSEWTDFFTTLWGSDPVTGFISVANGSSWTDTAFEWPEERRKMFRYIRQQSPSGDVYMSCAPMALGSTRRIEPNVEKVHTLWVDLDDDQVEDAVPRLLSLGGFVVNSGSDNHYHGYIHLSEPIEPLKAKLLNVKLKKLLGGDHKESLSTVLRVPGTRNHKHESAEVSLDETFWSALPVEPPDVIDVLGLDATKVEEVRDYDLTPVEVRRVPRAVQKILDLDGPAAKDAYTEGRSAAFSHLVLTALEHDLTPGQIATLVLDWDVAKAKYRTKSRILNEVQRILKKAHIEEILRPEAEGLPVYELDELADRGPTPFIIQNVVPEGGFTLITGESGSGKSFIAVDMAMSLAYGHTWAGYKTRQSKVLYVAMEGQNGVISRVKAWLKLKNVAHQRDRFKFLLTNFSFADDHMFDSLMTTIGQVQPNVIVVDTVAHAMSGLEENSATEMGAFISRVAEMERVCGSTTILIHHIAKNDPKNGSMKSRGSGALPAAANAAFNTKKLAKSSTISFSCMKQKDIEYTDTLNFELQSVEFNEVDSFGDPARDPAVAVFKEVSKGDVDETSNLEIAKAIYDTMIAPTTELPIPKTTLVKDKLLKRGGLYKKWGDMWDELVDWGVLVPAPGQENRQRGVAYTIAENHAEKWTAWLRSPMVNAVLSDDDDTDAG